MITPMVNIDYEFSGIQDGFDGEDFLLFTELETKSSFTISGYEVAWCNNFKQLLRKKIAEVRKRFEEGKP